MTELFRFFTHKGETARSFDAPVVQHKQDIKSAKVWMSQLQKLVELKKQRELARAS